MKMCLKINPIAIALPFILYCCFAKARAMIFCPSPIVLHEQVSGLYDIVTIPFPECKYTAGYLSIDHTRQNHCKEIKEKLIKSFLQLHAYRIACYYDPSVSHIAPYAINFSEFSKK